jgi:3-phenylpropionate/trans-cinnamate dioxygenase ferredoxin subunit
MTSWINVALVSDFPPDSFQVVDTDTVSILVFNIDGQFYAIENMCTHDGGTLSEGCLRGDEIICPRHGARFCVKTGAVTAPPAYEDVNIFPVRVDNGMVQITTERAI